MPLFFKTKKYLIHNIAHITIISLVLILPWWAYQTWIFDLSLILLFTAFFQKRVNLSAFYHEKILLLILLFVCYNYLSIFWSTNRDYDSLDFYLNTTRFEFYPLLIIGIYASNITKQNIEHIFLFLALSPIIIVYDYYALQFHFPTHTRYWALSIMRGIFHADLIANVYILFGAIFLYIKTFASLRNKEYRKLFFYFLAFCLYSGALFVFEPRVSRLINLTYFIIVSLIPLYYLPKKWVLTLYITIAVLSSSYLLNNKNFQRGFNNLSLAYSKGIYQGSFGARVGLFLVGSHIYFDHPFFGVGIVNPRSDIWAFHQEHPKYLQHTPERHFHNEHLNMLVQFGIIGYALFLTFIVLLYRLKIRNKDIHVFKNITLTTYMFLMLGEHYLTFKTTAILFIILIMLFIVYHRLEQEDFTKDVYVQ